jgi:hypothetical protein
VAARASGPDETPWDLVALVQLEHKADVAEAKDQCYLYTELLHGLTELAGRQMAAGQPEDAVFTVRQVDQVAVKLRAAAAKDPKRLKNAEQLLEHTTHRLGDMVRVAGAQEQAAMQVTLQHLNSVHDSLLALVFAH